MKQENTFWFRHFLLCNEMAKKMYAIRGFAKCENFAKLILEQDNGVRKNKQMTDYFWAADDFFRLLHGGDVVIFSENFKEFSLEDMAQLSNKEIESYFKEFIVNTGTVKI